MFDQRTPNIMAAARCGDGGALQAVLNRVRYPYRWEGLLVLEQLQARYITDMSTDLYSIPPNC